MGLISVFGESEFFLIKKKSETVARANELQSRVREISLLSFRTEQHFS